MPWGKYVFFDLFLWLVTFQPSHHVTPSQDASKQILFGIHADAPAGIGAVAEHRNDQTGRPSRNMRWPVTGALSTSPFHADQCPESDPASSNVGLAWGDDGRWPGFADFHVQLIAMLGSVSSRDGARQSVDFHFQGIVCLRGKFYTTKRFMMISRGCLIWMDRIGSSHGCVCKRAPYPSVMVI